MKLSIVATLYRSAPFIAEFHQRASAAARQAAADDYEIILVNDGSPDNSLDLAVQLTMEDRHVVLVDLSRNFGHHKAMMAGLEYASGERVFLLDSDLEEEPEWLMDFSQLMTEENADVVYGRQKKRKGNWLERWSGVAFYSIFNWLTYIDHPRNIVTARLMTRRYVDALLQYQEREVVISCLWVITGFKQCEKIVKKNNTSATTYSLFKKFQNAADAITSFSAVPLRIVFYVGTIIFLVAMVFACVLAFNRIFFSEPINGWTSVMVSIWVLGGMVTSTLGIIGIYLSRIFLETKRRPHFIVREVYGRPNKRH